MRALTGRRTLLGVAAAAAAAGVVAVILVASARSSDEPTRAQYLAEVAAICRVYGPKLDTIRPPDVAERDADPGVGAEQGAPTSQRAHSAALWSMPPVRGRSGTVEVRRAPARAAMVPAPARS